METPAAVMRRCSDEQTAQPSNLTTFQAEANALRELDGDSPGL